MDRSCTICNTKGDTRPYGKNGTYICYDCMKSTPEREAEAMSQMSKAFEAAGKVVLLTEDGPVPYNPDPSKLN